MKRYSGRLMDFLHFAVILMLFFLIPINPIVADGQPIDKEMESAEELCILGVRCLGNGRYEEAVEHFKKSIKKRAGLPEAYTGLGVAYEKLGRYKEAIESHKQAILIKPDYALAYYNLGVAYGNLGRYQEAVEASNQAIMIKRDFAEAHTSLGVAYERLGHYKEAIESHKQAILIKPDFAIAHYNLGVAYLKAKEKNMAIEQHRTLKTLDQELASKLLTMISPEGKENTVIYGLRVWIGSAIFALGVVGLIWWIRNLFRGQTMRAIGFSKHPILYFGTSIILIAAGLWVHSDFRLIPLIGLFAGILVGWLISRKPKVC
jgi:tetratricopeptide (TPR) repeat protein